MYFAYALMCIIFGTTFLAIKIGVNAGIPPFIFAGTRFLAAGLLVIGFFYLTGKNIKLSRSETKDAFYVGVTMTTALFAAIYWGEMYITSGLAALLAATAPMIVGLVQWKQGSGTLSLNKIAGFILGMGGVAVAVFPTMGSDGSIYAFIAVAVILLAQVCYSFGAVRSKAALSSVASPYLFNAYQMLFGSFFLILLSALVEPWRSLDLNNSVVWSWVYLTVLGSMVGHGIFYWLVRATNPMFPATWTYVSPIIAQFVGYLWLSEAMSVYSLLGLVLVISGLVLINKNLKLRIRESVQRGVAVTVKTNQTP